MNRQINKKNRNVHIGLVLAIFLMVPTMVGTVSAETFHNTYIDDNGFDEKNLTVFIGDWVQWINRGQNNLTLVYEGEEHIIIPNYMFTSQFNKEGTYEIYLKEYPIMKQKINVPDDCLRHMDCGETPIPSPTPIIPIEEETPIPIVTIPPVTIPVITPGPTITPDPITIPVITPGPTITPDPITIPVITPISTKRALLNVTFKIDRSEDKAIVTIKLMNIGDDTARFVNLSIDIPPEIGAEIISGAEKVGNKITWKGDIEPGKGHELIYSANPVKIDINMPLEITYIGDEKLNELANNAGISSDDVNAEFLEDIDPIFLQKILFIIQIAKAVLPGFEMIFGILGIGTIYILRRKNRI